MKPEIDFDYARSIGATHYRIFPHLCEWYKEIGEKWHYYRRGSKVWYACSEAFEEERIKTVPVPKEWTIYNNTLPLCELSDEQAAKLFNAWRGGKELQYESVDGFGRSLGGLIETDAVYRIKPKSEREQFIERCRELVAGEGLEPVEDKYFSILFDAGINSEATH